MSVKLRRSGAVWSAEFHRHNKGERRVLVSRRIRKEFENGREYYALHGRRIVQPADASNLGHVLRQSLTNKEPAANPPLLHHCIVSKINAGGMGDVYLA